MPEAYKQGSLHTQSNENAGFSIGTPKNAQNEAESL